jgi:hypothetical protein
MKTKLFEENGMGDEERSIYQQIIAFLLKESGNLKCNLLFPIQL